MSRIFNPVLRVCVFAAWAASPPHQAPHRSPKPAPEDLAKLEGPLTPMGAERAGNADGTNPAWSGKWVSTPPGVDYKPGQRFPDPYANEKPLFVITAQNMQQYEARLTDGEKALLKKYPDSFRFPSIRATAISAMATPCTRTSVCTRRPPR